MKWFRPSPQLEVAAPPSYRYGMLSMFAIAVLFVLLAPVYWNETQVRSSSIAEAYENADLYQFYYPVYNYAFGRLRAGSLPLWNPRQLCGTPLLADPRVGVFQPLNLPFLFLPAEKALAVNAFLCLFLMGLFFALFARAVGVGYLASALGGMVYAFSGLAAASMSRPPLAAALAWTPLLLWALREYAHRFDTAAAVIAGIVGALLVLSGAYAFLIVAALVGALYALQALVFVERGSAGMSKRVHGLLIILGISLGASAAQWIPTLVYAFRLDDPLSLIWGAQPATTEPASVKELFTQVILNESASLPRAAYIGIIPLVFAPAALFHRHRRRDAAMFAIIGVACALVVVFFGWRLPLHFPLVAMLFPVVLSVSLLTAIGTDRVFTPRRTFRSPSIWMPVLVVLIICITLFVLFGADVRRYIVPAVFAVLVFAPLRIRGLAPLCFILLGVVLLIDLVNANRTIYTHPRQDAPACYETYAQAISAAHDQSLGGRVMVSSRDLDRGLSPNMGMVGPLNMIGGIDLPITHDQRQWWDRVAGDTTKLARTSGNDITSGSSGAPLIRYMAARVLLAGPQGALYEGKWERPGPKLREVSPAADARIYLFDDSLSRAYWVPHAQVEVGMPATLEALCKPDFNAGEYCVVDAQSPGIGVLADRARAGANARPAARTDATCSVEDLTPERVVIRVDAPQDGVTVLSDSYDSGWFATLDGARKPILKVNGLFRGIATPAGPHEIRFTYRPWAVYIGLTISCATLIGTLIVSIGALAKPA